MEIVTLKKKGTFWKTLKEAHQAETIVSYTYGFYE